MGSVCKNGFRLPGDRGKCLALRGKSRMVGIQFRPWDDQQLKMK